MLEMYMNQMVEWKSKTEVDEYNTPSFVVQNVPARKEGKIRLVRDKHGSQVVSNTTVYTQRPVKVDDMIDGYVVLAVIDMPGLDGQPVGYEVMV